MASFALNFPTVKEWDEWYTEFKKDQPALNSNYTNFDSFFQSKPNVEELVYKMEKNRQEPNPVKDAVLGETVIKLTKFAAPIKECAWLVNENFVSEAMKWFNNNKDNQMFKSWHDKYDYLKVNLPTVEQVSDYQKCALRFRSDVPLPKTLAFEILKDTVPVTYKVSKETARPILDMFNDMENKRGKALGTGSKSEEGKETLLFNSDWMGQYINGLRHLLDMPPWGSWEKENRRGDLICHTSLLNYEQRRGDQSINIKARTKELEALYVEAKNEDSDVCPDVVLKMLNSLSAYEKFKRGATEMQEAAYAQQAAALDTLFSSCYWLWKSGASLKSFPALSKFLNELSHRAVGKVKLTSVLRSSGWKWGNGIAGMLSSGEFNGNKIHMHPAVLTSGRLSSDMTLCFGAVPAADPKSARNGCGSMRSILNLETNRKNMCASTIVDLFTVFCAGYNYKEEEIVPPEHMLHQSLLGKTSPFQNVSQREGSAFKVTIIH
ncbi:N [Sapphire II virus]|uniref:Nucleoprotein n=1 Tax=Sapphire II virus TaxID=1810945 RepID=A0A7D5DR83_9VIRU|nr:N [Sapphire II virus] [Sapphire II virus]QLA46843.1 N [Sapphire II virus] [Sapphire II virus]